MCNAPKFVKTEIRTGAGGGYNERDGVEYKERQDSDDEFDEVIFILRKDSAFLCHICFNIGSFIVNSLGGKRRRKELLQRKPKTTVKIKEAAKKRARKTTMMRMKMMMMMMRTFLNTN
jgi:hypothetical protein